MRSTTSAYREIIASGETRNWLVTINMTLADNTSLTITENDIMQGTFKIMSASSGDSSFDIGSAIIGKCQFCLDNWEDKFINYDFFNATAVVWVKLVGDSVYHRIGFYTVDEPTFAGSLLQIEMLDNMWKFDMTLPNMSYSMTARSAVLALCSHCGVSLGDQYFHGYNLSVDIPEEAEMNCRELLQYIAMMGCNFCYIDDSGELQLKWYDKGDFEQSLDGGTFNTNTTPYSDGDVADGGNFTDYTSGDSYDGGTFSGFEGVDYFTRLMSRNIGTDIITITGVKFTINDQDYRIGQDGYVLSLENPLVNEDNVNTILNSIWDVLEGFKIRPYNITALPDIAPEVGDSVAISYKGTMVYSYLTNFTFTPSLCTASLGAISPTRTLTKRYSAAVTAAVEVARRQTQEQISEYDLAVQLMNNLAVNAMGGFMDYEDVNTGGRIWYLSNMPITKINNVCSFEVGSTVFKMTGSGFFVSTDGGTTWTNGYDSQTGRLVVNVLNAIGISAEWIKTGVLDVGGSGTNATIRVKDATNNVICIIDTNGITMNKGVLQSADYSYTSGIYSTTGMIIDLVNTYMRSTAFYLNNSGGHIGAATFDDESITIRGDVTLGTGSFKFKPTDYYFAEDFKLSFQASEGFVGTSTVVVSLHQNGDTVIGTYTLTNDEPEETILLNHLIGTDPDDYYEVTVTSSSTVTSSVVDAILAYMGVGGFRGILEGIFRGHIDATGNFNGYLESEQGKIAGYSYTGTSGRFTRGDNYFDFGNMIINNDDFSVSKQISGGYRELIVNSANDNGLVMVAIGAESGFDPDTDTAEDLTNYIKARSVNFQNEQHFEIERNDDRGGDRVLWENELPTEVGNLYTIVTADPGEGVQLAEGHFILVVEP